jgi:hypothetical protein
MTAVGSTVERPTPRSRRRFGRRHFDKQPSDPAAVLIASTGQPFSPSAIRWAVQLAAGEPIAVVSLARIYGSAYGLPNPGLMPTRKEMQAQLDAVDAALKAIERAGGQGDGQVAATRKNTRTIARVAKARGVRHVLIVDAEKTGWRGVVEGHIEREVKHRVPAGVTVERVDP